MNSPIYDVMTYKVFRRMICIILAPPIEGGSIVMFKEIGVMFKGIDILQYMTS